MVRLLSWNVLADAYVKPAYYPHVAPALLAPGARTAAIIAHLAASGADVACLQEVEPAVIAALRVAGGWDDVHFAAKRGKPDGCALLARGGATLDEVRTLVFADGAPDRDDSGHVALRATLRVGARSYDLATMHLRWDPPTVASAERWSVRQVRELLRELGALDRAIVCGDLNVDPSDVAYRMLIDAGLRDPLAAADLPTANPHARAKRIDHVLVGAALVAQPLAVMAIADDTPLPSADMPSDHVPVGVAIEA